MRRIKHSYEAFSLFESDHEERTNKEIPKTTRHPSIAPRALMRKPRPERIACMLLPRSKNVVNAGHLVAVKDKRLVRVELL